MAKEQQIYILFGGREYLFREENRVVGSPEIDSTMNPTEVWSNKKVREWETVTWTVGYVKDCQLLQSIMFPGPDPS